jgi:drug/metabolite transporter, DME family
VSWGTTGAVTAILVQGAAANPLVIGAARLWVAAILLVLGARLVTGSMAVDRADRWACVAMGACMAAFQAAYFTAVTLAGIAVTALAAICSAPLIITALAVLTLGEPFTRRMAIALALGVTGTAALIVGPGASVNFSPGFIAGALLGLAAGLAYALYVVIAKASLARSAPLPLAAATFTVAAAFLTPSLIWTEAVGRQLVLGWPWLLYLGAVTTAAAYALYTTGLRMVPASVAGIVALLEPLTATLLGVWLFGEHLGMIGAAGAVLLFAAIALLVTDRV